MTEAASKSWAQKHVCFVTGRLAEHALRRVLEDIAPRLEFRYAIEVLPITVAALMTTDWIARHLPSLGPFDHLVIPGYCGGELDLIASKSRCPVVRGPRDLRNLPEFLGQSKGRPDNYGQFNIEILAEINHAPRLSREQIVESALTLRADGADVIDVGCDPGQAWLGVSDCVKELRDLGLRVSIDSMNIEEIAAAVRAGAELVLSVNHSNRDAAVDWGCEVVVIPDKPGSLVGLEESIDCLRADHVPHRLDPILEPIGCGFALSLGRYLEVRRRLPESEILMGIGNLTELTDADSAGINVLLLGFCQELGIRSVLTTQVINWARTSVRECDLARRLAHFSITNRVPPKHIEPSLVALRDAKLPKYLAGEFDELALQIKDHNYRMFADEESLHLISAALHLHDGDPFELFRKLLTTNPKNVDASHAFYLGYELAKASTARTLGKEYRQDESLNWGYLTIPERSHRARRKSSGQDCESDHQNSDGG